MRTLSINPDQNSPSLSVKENSLVSDFTLILEEGRSAIFFIYLNFFFSWFLRVGRHQTFFFYVTHWNSIQFSFLEDYHDYVNTWWQQYSFRNHKGNECTNEKLQSFWKLMFFFNIVKWMTQKHTETLISAFSNSGPYAGRGGGGQIIPKSCSFSPETWVYTSNFGLKIRIFLRFASPFVKTLKFAPPFSKPCVLSCSSLDFCVCRRLINCFAHGPQESVNKLFTNVFFLPRDWKKLAVTSNLMGQSGKWKQDYFFSP